MVPLGLASAAAVRVGHAVGAADGRRAVQAGWTALAVGAIITGSVGVLLIVTPTPLLRAFTDDPQLLSIGVRLLSIAAVFQLFDGTQAVATGVLRGVGDTRTPMAVTRRRPLGVRAAGGLVALFPARPGAWPACGSVSRSG
jgi:MATE family multidrug resistance protein